jgi:hypothetical protein
MLFLCSPDGDHKHEHIRLLGVGAPIAVAGQALVGLAADRRQRQVPAEPEGPIAGAGVVAQAQMGPEAAAAGAGAPSALALLPVPLDALGAIPRPSALTGSVPGEGPTMGVGEPLPVMASACRLTAGIRR